MYCRADRVHADILERLSELILRWVDARVWLMLADDAVANVLDKFSLGVRMTIIEARHTHVSLGRKTIRHYRK
jgi:hypothetical protein